MTMSRIASLSSLHFVRVSALAIATFGLAAAANAQTTVTLPDTSQTTTLTATVADQARVTVPAGVTFTVDDVTSATTSNTASVTVTNIVLASAAKQLRISLQANAASFTPPVALAATWAAGDVSWNAAAWTNAVGAAGTLSNVAYTPVATCTADAASCSTVALQFSLAANAAVKRSGNHTLVVRWKFESI
jgi:hypothetical protein